MSDLTVPTQKRLVLLAGRSYPELADEVAAQLGIPISPTTAYDFANGEIFIRSRSGAPTRSCSRATRRRSTPGSWSS